MTPDCELLKRYAETRSDDAFAELVRRHVNLVYSAALRQVNGDAALAQDVSQTVFTDLARKAATLTRHKSLSGWLYTGTRFAATKLVRSEHRRAAREQEATAMLELSQHHSSEPDWRALGPVLDEAMHELKEEDREAILLRYFEKRALAEIGAKLGLSENAARMRIDRALDKLRDLLARRGIASTAGLATALASNAVHAAPAGLAATLAGASVAAVGTASASTVSTILLMTKLKLIVGSLVVAGGASALFVQHKALLEQRAENQQLRQEISQLASENSRLSNTVARASQTLHDDQIQELLRLRGEVSMLRQKSRPAGNLQQQNQKLQAELDKVREQQQAEARRTATVNAVKQMAVAMIVFESDRGRFATNYDEMFDELGRTNVISGINLEEVEFVNAGLVDRSTPEKLIFRERAPRQLPNGKWERVYGFADGSVQVRTSDDGNFDEIEGEGMVMPQNQ